MNRISQKIWPMLVHFDLTYKCNQKCIHCCVVRKNRRELSLSEIKEILVQLANERGLLITFSGGEIFLRKDILEIISITHKLNFRTIIFSNGTLITPKVAKFLKKANISEVQISIYSTNPQIHDEITCCPNSFKKTLEGIKLLLDERVKVVIKTPLMKNIFNDYRKIKLFADELGVDYFFGPLIYPKMNFDKIPSNLSIDVQQMKELYLDSFALKKDLEKAKKHAEEFHILKSDLDKPICNAGYDRCYISPYGDVFPCALLWVKVGNLRYKKFKKVWYNSLALARIRNITFRNMKICLHCKFLPYCSPCPGMGYQGTENPLVPYNLHCRIAVAKYKAIKEKYNFERR